MVDIFKEATKNASESASEFALLSPPLTIPSSHLLV